MCQLSVREASAADLSDDRGDELRLERGLEGATLRDGQHPGQLVRRGLLGHAITSCIRRWATAMLRCGVARVVFLKACRTWMEPRRASVESCERIRQVASNVVR
jgi:hypothetical protein